MKKEFAIEEQWLPYEIHPDTPPKGVSLAERFRGHDIDGMYQMLRKRGVEFGIKFGNMKLLANSHFALLASEYAYDMGKFPQFHAKVFQAYFSDTRDIGNLDLICEIAQSCGLDPVGLRLAIQENRYQDHLDEAQRLGEQYQVSGVPHFVIEDQETIFGAESLDVFRQVLQKVK